MKNPKSIETHNMWALLCYCCPGDPMVCGIYDSKEEATKVVQEVKECPAKHEIVNCNTVITYVPKTKKINKKI